MEPLSLVDILNVFNNPISEEQAWAVCYQCSVFLVDHPEQEHYQNIVDKGIHSIQLGRQGEIELGDQRGELTSCVTSKTPIPETRPAPTCTGSRPQRRRVIATESHAVQALGTILFETLDYGIDQSEERQLSRDLESLIEAMTRSESARDAQNTTTSTLADDEGIVNDVDVESSFSFKDIIKMCHQHLSSSQEARQHYRAVCRAMAAEATELLTFLDRISTAKEKLSQEEDVDTKRLETLQRADWACMWVQVMRSMRQGVCLKKVEHCHLPPVEYELTPFEMLLEDIRSRRYTLRQVMVNGDIPMRVRNNAHEIILEFIRSRPPLRKVRSDYETDMKAQQTGQCKPELCDVPPNTPTEFMVQFFACLERKGLLNRTESSDLVVPPNEDKEAIDNCNNTFVNKKQIQNKARTSSPDLRERLMREIRSRPTLRPVKDGKLVVGTARPRLHSDDDQEPPSPARKVIRPDFNFLFHNSFEESSGEEDVFNSSSVPSSPMLDLSCASGATSPASASWRTTGVFRYENTRRRPSRQPRRHTIVVCERSYDRKKAGINAIECLNLTLEELTHIRSVFTKAELEALAWQPDIYQQVSKNKMCFTCRVTRFSLFGEWGTKCKICQRTVCSRCIRKMNVPTDHFRNIPVYALSSSLLTSETRDFVQKTIRTAPAPSVPSTRAASPERNYELRDRLHKPHMLRRPDSEESMVGCNYTELLSQSLVGHGPEEFLNESLVGQVSKKCISPSLVEHVPDDILNQSHLHHGGRSLPNRDKREFVWIKQSLKGTMMAICCECKKMVTEIIRSSRTSLAALSSPKSSSRVSVFDCWQLQAVTSHCQKVTNYNMFTGVNILDNMAG